MTTKTKSFADRVKAFQKIGDATKINRFSKDVIKGLRDTKAEAKAEIEAGEELLAEIEENKADHFLQIDHDAIKSVTTRGKYVETYLSELINYDSTVKVSEDRTVNEIKQAIEDSHKVVALVEKAEEFFNTVEASVEVEE